MNYNKPVYTRLNHFHHQLQKFSDRETTTVPNDILEQIKKDLCNYDNFTANDIRCSLKKLNLRKYYEHIPTINRLLSNNYKDISNIVTQENKDKNFECPICLQTDIANISKLKCNHIYCKVCTDMIIENNSIKCPLCRREYITKIIGPNKLTDEQIIKLMEDFEHILSKYDEINKTKGSSGRMNFLSYNYIIKKLAQMQNIELDTIDFISSEKQRMNDHIWNEIVKMNDQQVINDDQFCKLCLS